MEVIDIHTHHGCSEERIHNFILGRESISPVATAYSAGFHPWYIPESWESFLPELEHRAATDAHMVAVGECGLDFSVQVPKDLQLEAFIAQCKLAEHFQKPMILHVVKAHSEILSVRKRLQAVQPWIIHGFRGNPQLAQQYIAAGCCLSFGARFNEHTPPSIPLHSLLLETDESDTPISDIASKVAGCCQISTETLLQEVVSNVQRLFFKHHDCLFG